MGSSADFVGSFIVSLTVMLIAIFLITRVLITVMLITNVLIAIVSPTHVSLSTYNVASVDGTRLKTASALIYYALENVEQYIPG